MATTPILESVPKKEIAALASQGIVRSYRRGSYLFYQDEEAPEVFLLVQGRVEISSVAPSGHRQWLTNVDPPQFLGELGVLGEIPRTASGLAIEDSKVWVVSGKVFKDFICQHPDASAAILKALSRQVQAFGAFVEDLLFLDLRGRVAKRLVGLISPSLDDPAPNGATLPQITHADLASLAGGSRENVSRILSDLQRRGFIEKVGRRYVLKNVKALLKLSNM